MFYFLDITSWVGTCAIGAEHYYGEIRKRGQLESVKLQYRLGRKEASALNKKERPIFKYKTGELSTRFFSEDDVRSAARKWFSKNAKEGDFLIESRAWYPSTPHEILEGPLRIKNRANILCGDYKEQISEKKRDSISKKWRRLVEPFADNE